MTSIPSRRRQLVIVLCLLLGGLIDSPATAPRPTRGAEPAARNAGRPEPPRLRRTPMQAGIAMARKSKTAFVNPQEFPHEAVHELKLTTGEFPNPQGPQLGLPGRFRLLSYNGLPYGPVIRVRRGSTLKIHLKNDLAAKPDIPPTDSTKYPSSSTAEMPHKMGRTNLHTHGLHVSPADPGDNIFNCFDPGEDYPFVFNIPADHPAGTFWYHPHNHGSVAYQLSNGVAGALIVEGSRNDGIADLEDIPEVAAAAERILVFQLYNFRAHKDPAGKDPAGDVAADAIGWIDASTIYNIQVDSVRCGAIDVPGQDQDPNQSVAFQATAINGQFNPTLTIAPGEVQRWRLIHAAWDLDRHLTIVDDNDQPTADLTFHEIALDGLATGTIVKKTDVEIAPGQRSDVLIKAPLLPPDVPERVYHLKQTDVPGGSAPHGAAQDPLYLAKIVVIGTPRHMRLPEPSELARCRPFADIHETELSPSPSSRRSFTFAADDGNDAGNPNPPFPYYTINDKVFHDQTPLPLVLNTAEEWTLKAGKSSHPFHIHVNPFQVVHYIDPENNQTTMNVWRDTLYIKEGETYRIRSRFRDFAGKAVFHCHILDHEDQGMMMPIQFSHPGQPLPPQTICADLKKDAPKLASTATPAPPLRLPDTRGVTRDLAEFRERNVVLVFFQGMECAHCAGALRDLVRSARDLAAPDREIVAVTSRRIADPARALANLGVLTRDRFHLLVDEAHRGFRDFGCYDRGPRHGLFLIDRAGVIRSRYVGDAPFDDTRQVVERIRAFPIQ